MPDVTREWYAPPTWPEARIAFAGGTAQIVTGLSQVLVSGDGDWLGPAFGPEIGLWQQAPTDTGYRVRIGRDQVLLVSSMEINLPSGWRSEGWAASSAHDAWLIIDIEGAIMHDIVAELTAADLSAASPSAAIRIMKMTNVLLYRVELERARIHVEAAFGPWLWRWLELRDR